MYNVIVKRWRKMEKRMTTVGNYNQYVASFYDSPQLPPDLLIN